MNYVLFHSRQRWSSASSSWHTESIEQWIILVGIRVHDLVQDHDIVVTAIAVARHGISACLSDGV
jgi:hypothetical protein